jgi:UDP-N-acetylmuramate dehydrogenase
MTEIDEVATALRSQGVPFREHEPLQKRTWWRAGGHADLWIEASDLSTLERTVRVARATSTPVFPLGNASNLLISDAGIRGIVVRLTGELARAEALPDRRVRIGAGAKLVQLLARAEAAGWPGLERLAGIPGTMGGAVRTNAGTALGELSDILVEVDLLHQDGTPATLGKDDLQMGYRRCAWPEGAIATAVTVALTDEDPKLAYAHAAEHLAYRARTQPVDVPTCGSTFRNPPGDRAGRLIEACGLKGRTVGAAQVSPKHANFLVNLGGATADDLRRLLETVQAEVARQTGVQLEPEVHFAGDWSHWQPSAVTGR